MNNYRLFSRKPTKLQVIVLAIVATLATLLVHAELTLADTFTVTGRLIENGSPMASVAVSAGTAATTTDSNGLFTLDLAGGDHSVAFDVGADRFPESVEVSVADKPVDCGTIDINILEWQYDAGNWINTYPIVSDTGDIIFLTYDGRLVSVRPDGTLKCSVDLSSVNHEFNYAPSQDYDGTLYVPCALNLRAYTSTGEFLWSFDAGEYGIGSAPAIRDGVLYFGSNTKIYAIDTTGNELWSYTTGSVTGCSPSIAADGTIYVSCYDNNVYAFNPDGTVKWKYAATQPFNHTPVIGADGTIYAGCYDMSLHAINPDGTPKWTFDTGSVITCPPVIDAAGNLYCPTQSKEILSISPEGVLNWRRQEPHPISRSLIITSQDVLLAGVQFTGLVEYGLDGTRRWVQQFEEQTVTWPIVTGDGSVFFVLNAISARSGILCSYRSSGMGYQKDAPWPCPMGNNNRTGLITDSLITSVDSTHDGYDRGSDTKPRIVTLNPNHPNPFNQSTTISFSLTEPAAAKLDIYTVTGARVATLVDSSLPAGRHSVNWSAERCSSSMYFYTVTAGSATVSGKMLLLR